MTGQAVVYGAVYGEQTNDDDQRQVRGKAAERIDEMCSLQSMF